MFSQLMSYAEFGHWGQQRYMISTRGMTISQEQDTHVFTME
jgi:hypothetical protein